jgi:hypothetical protein
VQHPCSQDKTVALWRMLFASVRWDCLGVRITKPVLGPRHVQYDHLYGSFVTVLCQRCCIRAPQAKCHVERI